MAPDPPQATADAGADPCCPSKEPSPAAAGAASPEHTALTERLVGYVAGALTSNLIHLGDKLGLYAGLKAHGPCTAADLAAALGLNARYTTEWLRQQAAAKVIATDDGAERYWLTPAQADVLVNERGPDASPAFFAGFFSGMPALAKVAEDRLPALFMKGGGISYDEVEPAVTCSICRELGVWVRHALVPSLSALPGMQAQLEAGCRVADVGCGCGEALLTLAEAFPASTFHGFDISEDALSAGRAEAKRRGLANLSFFNPGLDEERMPEQGTYQLVQTHDAIHDMAHPTKVMASVRRAVATGGVWIIGDMNSLESHPDNVHHHPLATVMYGFSSHLCLPSGMSAPDGAALGTLGISASKMCSMLRDAGFASAEVLEAWEHPLNRYYIART